MNRIRPRTTLWYLLLLAFGLTTGLSRADEPSPAARFGSAYVSDETLLTREFTFSRGMSPLRITLPAASLSGRLAGPDGRLWHRTEIEAVPDEPGLPTRTCHGEAGFRFIGLAPGRYTLRFQADGWEPKQIDDVVVRKGMATRLDKVILKPDPSNPRAHDRAAP